MPNAACAFACKDINRSWQRAVHDTLKAQREGTPAERLDGIAGDYMMKQVMRNEDYARWAKDYL